MSSDAVASPHQLHAATFPQCLRQRAELHGNRIAVTFLPDEHFTGDGHPQHLTYRELWERAVTVAGSIRRAFDATAEAAAGGTAGAVLDAPRALLLYPPGLEFLVAFVGTQLAGGIPVPTAFPRPHREIPRLNAAGRDCRPALLLTDQANRESLAVDKLAPQLREITVVATDAMASPAAEPGVRAATLAEQPEEIAFLQYTSGSTSAPKGVAVRQRNLMANLEAIRRGFQLDWVPHDAEMRQQPIDAAAFWLPFYHDMGLVGGILAPLYIGGRTILFSPRAFLQRPIRWLQVISDYRARISGAPNFAYQLCVDRIPPDQTDRLSLASWEVAFCGAEPISPRTLLDFQRRFATRGFSGEAFYPCYGLAEATLLVAGGRGPAPIQVLSLERSAYQSGTVRVLDEAAVAKTSKRDRQELVSCGQAAEGTQVVIVDPKRGRERDADEIGEIWVRGESVAAGYWSELQAPTSNVNEPKDAGEESTESRFDAALADGRCGFCRSGDLGFLHEGQLYVTGRSKELIILRGRNLFPQDIESTVIDCLGEELAKAGPSLTPSGSGSAAAFSVLAGRSEALAVVAELPRQGSGLDLEHLSRSVRRRLIEEHEVDPKHIWLARPAAVPVTTSGKIRRGACRQSFQKDSIPTFHRYDRSSVSDGAPIPFPSLPDFPGPDQGPLVRQAVQAWLGDWLVARAGIAPDELCADKSLSEFGLDSLAAVELSGETEDWTGVRVTPEVATQNPTIAELSAYIADHYVNHRSA